MSKRFMYVVVAFALLAVLGAGFNITLYQTTRDQQAKVARLQAALANARKHQSDQEYARCVASIAGTGAANQVIQNVRDIADGLAATTSDLLRQDIATGDTDAVKTRTKALATWRRVRAKIKTFPVPSCVRNGP